MEVGTYHFTWVLSPKYDLNTYITTLFVGLRAGLDLHSGLKNGPGCKNPTPLIGRENRAGLFKFTP